MGFFYTVKIHCILYFFSLLRCFSSTFYRKTDKNEKKKKKKGKIICTMLLPSFVFMKSA